MIAPASMEDERGEDNARLSVVLTVLVLAFVVAVLTGCAETASGGGGGSNCNQNYSGCLKASSSDYDCAGGSGNGPDYTGTVRVLGYDEYGLDADGDGVGCD